MALSDVEKNFIGSTIRGVLEEHARRPFFILREAGVVAELRARLVSDDAPFGHASPRPFIQNLLAKQQPRYHYPPDLKMDVSRVQMEVTLNTALADKTRTWKKTLDIAILTEQPQLSVYDNGPGDVVEQVPPDSVAAAFEVKASPSADKAERGKYVKDILTLLWLRREHGIPGYFLLLDKSQRLYGSPNVESQLPMVWNSNADQQITIRSSQPIPTPNRQSLAAWNLQVSDNPVPEESVEIWMIDTDGQTVRRRYASFKDSDAVDQVGSDHHWLSQIKETKKV